MLWQTKNPTHNPYFPVSKFPSMNDKKKYYFSYAYAPCFIPSEKTPGPIG
jgi:hypothetical protein